MPSLAPEPPDYKGHGGSGSSRKRDKHHGERERIESSRNGREANVEWHQEIAKKIQEAKSHRSALQGCGLRRHEG